MLDTDPKKLQIDTRRRSIAGQLEPRQARIIFVDPLGQLPPTILSAKQKTSAVKVKVRPLDFPETKSVLGEASPAGTLSADDATAQPIDGPVKADSPSDAPELDESGSFEAADSKEDQPAAPQSPALGLESQKVSRQAGKATLYTAQSSKDQVINETADLSDDPYPREGIDGENSSDELVKDDMQEDNPSVRRTRLEPPRTLETTMFDRLERMFGAGIKRLLSVQYR